ncbi:hypothetical protein MEZE111188_21060 [Mesobacillus zeae]
MNLLLVAGLFLFIPFIVGFIGMRNINVPEILLYILLSLALSQVFYDNKVLETAGEIGFAFFRT